MMVFLCATTAAQAATLTIHFEKNGQDTIVTPANTGVLDGTHYLKKAYGVLQESRMQGYMHAQMERTDRDVDIHLVDDGQGDKIWPHASGPALWLGESYFSWPTTKASIRGLVGHEFAHTQDRSTFEPGAYGPDGKHYLNEEISQRAAMMEGWADYWGQHFDFWGKVNAEMEGIPLFRKQEDATQAGKYHWHPITSFTDEMKDEEVVAAILWKLDKSIPEGARKVSDAFNATNDGTPRTLPSYLTAFASADEADSGKACVLVDKATGFTASDDQLTQIFGAGAQGYISKYRRFLRPLAAIATLSLPAIGSSLIAPVAQGLTSVAGKLAKAGGTFVHDLEGVPGALHLAGLFGKSSSGHAGSAPIPVDTKNPLSAVDELIVH